uniref:CCR4-NOT transcription complex subunit 3 n=3 Tax=Rhodnius TaxID=13248 RepID=T1HIJ7_RHOPR
MAATRKLQGEIERCLKKVTEGVETFEDIWQKVHNATNSNQKEKYEADLKKEIKKLQRLRDQIKSWIASAEIKDKSALLEYRKLIETQMERFKVVERETKTKAYSKEGLGAAQKMDPAQKEKEEISGWLIQSIDALNLQLDQFESEIESLLAGKKKRLDKDKQDRMDELKAKVEKHRYHIRKLETLLRMLDNLSVEVSQIKGIKDDVEYYIESSQDPDFEGNEYIYDDIIGLDDIELSGVGQPSSATTDSNGTPTSITSSPPPSPPLSGSQTIMPPSSAPTHNHSSDNSSNEEKRRNSDQIPQKVVVKPMAVRASNNTSSVLNCNSTNSGTGKGSSNSNSTTNSSNNNKSTSFSTPNNCSPSSGTQASVSVPVATNTHASNFAAVTAQHNKHSSKQIYPTYQPPPEAYTYISIIRNRSGNQQSARPLQSVGFQGKFLNSIVVMPELEHGFECHCKAGVEWTRDVVVLIFKSTYFLKATLSRRIIQHLILFKITNFLCIKSLFSNVLESPTFHQTGAENGVSNSTEQSNSVNNSTSGLSGGGRETIGGPLSSTPVPPMMNNNSGGESSSSPPSSVSSAPSPAPVTPPTPPPAPSITSVVSSTSTSVTTSSDQPSLSTLKSIAQQVIDRAGLDITTSEPTRPVSFVKPKFFHFLTKNLVLVEIKLFRSVSNSTYENKSNNTGEAQIPPLLGVAPLGPVPLQKEHQCQFQMMEAAYYHMPHPADSERVRQYLPRTPCHTPVYYHQVPLAHSDTLEFFQRLSTETLFFIFYYMEGSKAQYLAAKALKKQSWRFHTKYMMWFQRHEEPKLINEEYEQGTYIYFDYEKWGQRKKEGFTFEYKYLEDRDLN